MSQVFFLLTSEPTQQQLDHLQARALTSSPEWNGNGHTGTLTNMDVGTAC
jgi:hypothetical protein